MQSTQSSGTVFFRAVVMVGFLAVIFYAALSGNALPDAARKQIEKYLPRALASSKSANPENANAASEAPLFNNAQENKTALSMNSAPSASMEIPNAPRKLPMDGSASLLSVPPTAGVPPLQSNNNASPVVPVNYLTPPEAPSGAVASALQNANLPSNSAGTTPFSQIQDRLKQLGATYYLLETWGNQQQLYRFYCKMAVGGNSNYTHCFEYIGADPLQAMAEVLKQVENWRSGGSAMR